MKSILFNLPTEHQAHDLSEFADCLKKISVHSLYYHMFEARLRTTRGKNDLSFWLDSIGEEALARQVERLDPYTHTMEELRTRILRLAERRLKGENYATVG